MNAQAIFVENPTELSPIPVHYLLNKSEQTNGLELPNELLNLNELLNFSCCLTLPNNLTLF